MKPIQKILIISAIQACLFTSLNAQTDTVFWFVAPEVENSHGDRPIYLRLSTLDQPSTVTLSLPADLSFSPIITNVAKNSSKSIDLTPFIDILENKPADNILNKGILIQATNKITAYYEVFTYYRQIRSSSYN